MSICRSSLVSFSYLDINKLDIHCPTSARAGGEYQTNYSIMRNEVLGRSASFSEGNPPEMAAQVQWYGTPLLPWKQVAFSLQHIGNNETSLGRPFKNHSTKYLPLYPLKIIYQRLDLLHQGLPARVTPLGMVIVLPSRPGRIACSHEVFAMANRPTLTSSSSSSPTEAPTAEVIPSIQILSGFRSHAMRST
ncbi:hypothetical protein OUZ56_003455 [Daphnia magna]|uniref:Uncharacterized protein n=1 Tax=Daphnia magna TaxID=35525 RepID=A0ABR0A8U1_9CRUS|nr:hypothetical protein OUZ56_003455 [Daphnia magna]